MTTVVQYALGGCLLLCFLQTYLAGAQECRTCYRSVSYQSTRLTTRTTSQRTRCYVFFRCTNYRIVYQTGTYTAYRTISYCCHGTGSIGNGTLQLRGGPSESHGRLEIYYNAQWGTVCDDSFGSFDAEVACMQLGFAGHSASIQEFGGGSDPIWLDDVQCIGTETWLPNCTSSNWGIHNCAHREDVGVKCNSALQIRLVGGGSNPFSGRVEYYLQGIWATVCDDYFGTADGNVVCNQLGYGNATGTPSFGAGIGSIAFDDLECSGDEISLLFCPHLGNFQHNCNHNEDVGIICEGPKPTITTVRASSSLSVFLEWEMPWQLNYQTFIRGYRVQYGTSTSVHALRTSNVSTMSASASVTISSLLPGTTYYFRVALKANVSQYGPYSGFVTATTSGAEEVRLVGGSGPHEGRVEVLHNGTWGTVCDDGWDLQDATAVCRQLGYSRAVSALGFAFYGKGSGPIWYDEVRCSGSEASLTECAHDGLGVHDCAHWEDAGVMCASEIEVRLVGGAGPHEGRVEVLYNGTGGTVCDDGWNLQDATVVCRQLGYSRAVAALGSARFGAGSGPILISELSCIGNESIIAECHHLLTGVHNCNHSEDVGVICEDYPKCTFNYCRRKRKDRCTITEATGNCTSKMTSCKTAYYSVNERPPPLKCSRSNRCAAGLSGERLKICLNKWANCVKKAFKAQYGKTAVNLRNRAFFKILEYPCDS